MNFNIEQKGNKSDRDKSLTRLLKSPAIMASGFSKTTFLSSDPDELMKLIEKFWNLILLDRVQLKYLQ